MFKPAPPKSYDQPRLVDPFRLCMLCLLSARIASKPIEEVVADGTIWIVLSRTQFGFAWSCDSCSLSCLPSAFGSDRQKR